MALKKQHKKAWIESMARLAQQYGLSLDLILECLRLEGYNEVHACGCASSEAWGLTVWCKEHKREHDRMARKIPRACPCGEVNRLTARTAAAHRMRDHERIEELRKQRREHVCPTQERRHCPVCGQWQPADGFIEALCADCGRAK